MRTVQIVLIRLGYAIEKKVLGSSKCLQNEITLNKGMTQGEHV